MLIIYFSDKCYTTGNFDLNEKDLIEFSAIEKQPIEGNVCKGYLKGNANQHYRNFVCIDDELNNKVKSDIMYARHYNPLLNTNHT